MQAWRDRRRSEDKWPYGPHQPGCMDLLESMEQLDDATLHALRSATSMDLDAFVRAKAAHLILVARDVARHEAITRAREIACRRS